MWVWPTLNSQMWVCSYVFSFFSDQASFWRLLSHIVLCFVFVQLDLWPFCITKIYLELEIETKCFPLPSVCPSLLS